jgi:hypothetical protein
MNEVHHDLEVSIDIIRCGVKDVQCRGFFISDLDSLMLQQKFNIDCGKFEHEVSVNIIICCVRDVEHPGFVISDWDSLMFAAKG